jgi:hypothetical protein
LKHQQWGVSGGCIANSGDGEYEAGDIEIYRLEYKGTLRLVPLAIKAVWVKAVQKRMGLLQGRDVGSGQKHILFPEQFHLTVLFLGLLG